MCMLLNNNLIHVQKNYSFWQDLLSASTWYYNFESHDSINWLSNEKHPPVKVLNNRQQQIPIMTQYNGNNLRNTPNIVIEKNFTEHPPPV